MITSLHIQNIGIIEDLCIDFGKGFNVLTGETGAGKTLIIDSLQILAGGRFSKEMIRTGQEYSFVELSLNLNNNEDVIISREINISGKNVCKINGRMVTVNELRDYMKDIIDIHGQHENQSILEPQMHIQYLDYFAGQELLIVKEQYQNYYEKLNKLKAELSSNFGDEQERQRKLDLLKYQLNEITSSKLRIGEDEELETQRKIMMNSELITENLCSASYQANSGVDTLGVARRNLEKIADVDSKYGEYLNSLNEIYYNLEELARDIGFEKDNIDFDEEKRQEVETRLDMIFSLKRKYGNSIEEILKYADEIKNEIDRIENLEEYNDKIKQEIEQTKQEMIKLANQMHNLRTDSARKLDEKISNELSDLEMKNAKFKVDIKQCESFNKNGLDEIEFLIATNMGEGFKPLIKIASGGELSRIMLGIKTVLADIDKVPVLVFDEIDTGISGIAANKVAEKLKLISKKHQVLCITHQAVIAAKGDENYYISKEVSEGRTKTILKKLNEDEVIREVARIASGEITQVALEHAKSLRKI